MFEDSGNKCGKCQNHDFEVLKKGHARDCPFKRCNCLKCRLLDARSDILQVISGKETKLKGTKKDPNCGFCQNHGIKILRKGHVRSCGFGQERHFRLDNCFDCEVHYIRNEVNRLQIKMRRAMKEDRSLSEEQRKTAREAITRDEVEKVCDMARMARKKREAILSQQQQQQPGDQAASAPDSGAPAVGLQLPEELLGQLAPQNLHRHAHTHEQAQQLALGPHDQSQDHDVISHDERDDYDEQADDREHDEVDPIELDLEPSEVDVIGGECSVTGNQHQPLVRMLSCSASSSNSSASSECASLSIAHRRKLNGQPQGHAHQVAQLQEPPGSCPPMVAINLHQSQTPRTLQPPAEASPVWRPWSQQQHQAVVAAMAAQHHAQHHDQQQQQQQQQHQMLQIHIQQQQQQNQQQQHHHHLHQQQQHQQPQARHNNHQQHHHQNPSSNSHLQQQQQVQLSRQLGALANEQPAIQTTNELNPINNHNHNQQPQQFFNHNHNNNNSNHHQLLGLLTGQPLDQQEPHPEQPVALTVARSLQEQHILNTLFQYIMDQIGNQVPR